MYDAVMHQRLREHLWQSRRQSRRRHRRAQDVVDSPTRELRPHTEPEARALGLHNPAARHVLVSLAAAPNEKYTAFFRTTPSQQLSRLSRKDHHRNHAIEQALLASLHFEHHANGNDADRVRLHGYFGLSFQVRPNLAHRHAARLLRGRECVELGKRRRANGTNCGRRLQSRPCGISSGSASIVVSSVLDVEPLR